MLCPFHLSCCSPVVHSLSQVQLLKPHGLQHARLPWPPRSPESAHILVHWVSDAVEPLIPCCCLLLLLHSFQYQGLFQWACSSHQYWSFSFSISSSNEYSGLIYFRIDYFDLLAGQGTLKSLFQLHSSKTAIVQCLAFFTVHIWTRLLEKP